MPEPHGALLGKVKAGDKDYEKMAGEAARTIPGYESSLTSGQLQLYLDA